MKRGVLLVLAANLVAAAVLLLAYPHLMIAPGPLIEGHRKYETDCFACHRPFLATPAGRCIACHKLDDVGLRTTLGVPIVQPKLKVAFHQRLIEQDCVACHGDHRGAAKYRVGRRFSHALLQTALRAECEGCHRLPDDALHRQITGNCKQCHTEQRWKPVTFDHAKYFVLDRDHNVKCATCHVGSDYKRYTCYGCHEHTPANIRAEHLEEGIFEFENCVECHRSADEEPRRPGGRDADRRRGRD